MFESSANAENDDWTGRDLMSFFKVGLAVVNIGLAGAELRATSPDRVIEAQISLTEVVICDIGRISQLLSNLVANALAYGHVMLRSKCEAGYSRMSLKYSFPIRVIRYPKSRLSICSSRSFAEPISPARAG